MSERRLRADLRALPVPGAAAAEERAWALLRAAHAAREPAPAPRMRLRPVLALAVVAAAAAAFLSPPGLAVLGSLRQALAPGSARVRTVLTTLPAPGRLLVDSTDGAWVVGDDGTRRRLGPYRDATWSPHGLYVAAVHGHDLVALAPDGTIRWTLTRAAPPRLPSWNAPDGYRIAYLSGGALHVVQGDGAGDRVLAAQAAAIRPAWRPGAAHDLAYVRRDGTVVVVAADSGSLLWTRRRPERPLQLSWSADGTRLLVLASRHLTLDDARGRLVTERTLPPATTAVAAAFRPGSHDVVEIRRRRGQSTVVLLPSGRVLASLPGAVDGLDWSPDGRWLLLGWSSANQWLFVRVDTRRRTVLSFGRIADAFAPGTGGGPAAFPALAGWCCGG